MSDMPFGIESFGLTAPARQLLPAYSPFRESPGNASLRAAAERDRKARLAADLAAAEADWTAVRDRLAGNAPALAVLDLHEPEAFGGLTCTVCYDGPDGGYEDWPCLTFTALKNVSGDDRDR